MFRILDEVKALGIRFDDTNTIGFTEGAYLITERLLYKTATSSSRHAMKA